ncbi:MAG TPA: agmatine deiminase family protein, partial [Alphaproteobacteria bacterium]|nr:agmatine deiminase family protein [Alphaproteobacteria bacterium]
MTVPTDESFYMPAEWQHHTRCWMAWPEREELWGEHLEAARNAYAEVAHAIALFEPVTMIAKSKNVAEVSIRCKGKVNTLAVAHDDSWLRDNGPTFVVNPKKGVAAIRWQWNAWGNKYPGYERDALVSEAILNHLGIRWFNAPMVMEGGAIHVDESTVLVAYASPMPPLTTLESLHQTAAYNITGTLPAPLISPAGFPDVQMYEDPISVT